MNDPTTLAMIEQALAAASWTLGSILRAQELLPALEDVLRAVRRLPSPARRAVLHVALQIASGAILELPQEPKETSTWPQ